MEGIQMQRIVSDDPEAVRKRKSRMELREKRRQETFVSKCLQIKHPNIYAKIKESYKEWAEKFPDKYDITKTYYFKKWEKQTRQQQQQQTTLYVPHLPILSNLHEVTNARMEIIEEGQQQEQTPQSPIQEETPQPPGQEETPQPSQEETPQPPGQEETPQPSQEETPQSPILHPQDNNSFFGMSLNDMEIAAQEIVSLLESDRELMDIVENFDLPAGVWDAELSIPDYVLEGDLEW